MIRLQPGKDDHSFNLYDLTADQVERILATLTDVERSILGHDTGSSMTLNLVSKLLQQSKQAQQVQQQMGAPEGTTAPPQNG